VTARPQKFSYCMNRHYLYCIGSSVLSPSQATFSMGSTGSLLCYCFIVSTICFYCMDRNWVADPYLTRRSKSFFVSKNSHYKGFVLFVCLFHLYPPVTRKRHGAIFWTNPHPLRSCPFPSFPIVSLTSYH